jgi:serine/threonine-protein kinase
MSEVHAAHDHLLDRVVAIKRPNLETSDFAHSDRLRREAVAMAHVESPHVVAIHDIGTDDQGMYLVMQYVHGATIEQEVQRFGTCDAARASRIGLDILAGLSAIHRQGLVHRDLKPSNIILDRDDFAVLLDLGVALHRRKCSITPFGSATGTPEFMAPEQLEAQPLDGRTDLYQLGRILVYLVTGLDAERDIEVGLERMPGSLAAVARRAMAPLAERYATCEQMRAALLQIRCSLSPDRNIDRTVAVPVDLK